MNWTKFESVAPRRGSIIWVLEELRSGRGLQGYATALYRVSAYECTREKKDEPHMFPITRERWHSDGSPMNTEGYEAYPVAWSEMDIPRQPMVLMTGAYDCEILNEGTAAAIRAWLHAHEDVE